MRRIHPQLRVRPYHLKCWILCQPSTYMIRGVAELSFPAGIVRMLRGLVVFQHERTGLRKTNVIRQAVLEILIIFLSICVYTVCMSSCVCFIKTYIHGGGSINLMYGHPTTHSPSTTANNEAATTQLLRRRSNQISSYIERI